MYKQVIENKNINDMYMRDSVFRSCVKDGLRNKRSFESVLTSSLLIHVEVNRDLINNINSIKTNSLLGRFNA